MSVESSESNEADSANGGTEIKLATEPTNKRKQVTTGDFLLSDNLFHNLCYAGDEDEKKTTIR
jgi:hypothetical protein